MLNVSINIHSIYVAPLGRKDAKYCPLLVKFTYFADIQLILKVAKKLKNTGFFIHRDFPNNIRLKRSKLLLLRREILRVNNNLKVVVFDDNLSFSNHRFEWCVTRGLIAGDAEGVSKLNEVLGRDLSGFITSLRNNSLPKDYFIKQGVSSVGSSLIPATAGKSSFS